MTRWEGADGWEALGIGMPALPDGRPALEQSPATDRGTRRQAAGLWVLLAGW